MDDGTDVLRRADAAFTEQSHHIHLWREAASFCLPRKIYILNGGASNALIPYTPDPKLQNSVAVKALRDLAAGMCTAFLNASEVWAQLEPSDYLPVRSDRYHSWLLNATRVLMRSLPASGFYSRAYEMLLDAGATGTGAMKIEGKVPGSDAVLNCETLDVGSYAIAENCAGHVEHLWRKLEYTVAQAEKEWPDFQAPGWKGLTSEKRLTKRDKFTLEIRPRDEKEVGQKPGPQGMKYEGTIVHDASKEVVWRGGWPEFPVRAYRFQRQSGPSPWGTGPGIEALPDCRGVNFLDTAMADGIGKAVDPPVAVKDDMRGVLDLRMGGVSAVSSLAEMPKPIFEVGNLQAANAFFDVKVRQLREHFYTDLFTPFLSDHRTLKAAQVYEIKSDVLNIFAPFGFRFLEEFVTPFIERAFMVLLRQGMFGPVPPEAIHNGFFPYPKVVHQSRMALEIQNLAKGQVRQLLADIAPIAAIAPEQLDWLNFPAIIKLLGGNSVLMPEVLNTPDQFAAIQQARAQAAQQAQALDMAAKFATKNPDHAAAAVQEMAAA